jgi:hypothetical protein
MLYIINGLYWFFASKPPEDALLSHSGPSDNVKIKRTPAQETPGDLGHQERV